MKNTIIDKYILEFPKDIQAVLNKVRQTIKAAMPEALEKMSYGMPTFWQGENIVHFAGLKNHLGFYPTPSGVAAFTERLKDYKTSKGAIQMPYDSVDYELIADITRFRLAKAAENEIKHGKTQKSPCSFVGRRSD